MLTGTSRPKREDGRSLNNEELQNLHSPPNIRVKKLKRMVKAEHVSLMGQTKVYLPQQHVVGIFDNRIPKRIAKISLGERRPAGKAMNRWEDEV